MKKIFALIIILIFSTQISYGNTKNSSNDFKILIDSTQKNDAINKKHDSNLSDGAKTAIVLGSIFGGLILSGVGYHYYKKGIILDSCIVRNKNCALIPDCLYNFDFYKKHRKTNYYLNKIFKCENLDETCEKKYIIIEDRFIKNKSYHRFYFKLDKNYSKIRIIQYSKPYELKQNTPELDIKIYNSITNKEIPLSAKILDYTNGKLIKNGFIDFKKDDYYYFDISLVTKTKSNVYATVIELE